MSEIRPAVRALAFAAPYLKVFAVMVLVLVVASMRVFYSGESELAKSTEALKRKDPEAAIVHARRAAGFYLPGAPHVRVAYERLNALAAAAEGLGDRETSLLAFRAIRTAAIETRWIVTPHEKDLERANAEIARLSAAAPRPPAKRNESTAKIETMHAALLSQRETPREATMAVLLLALVVTSFSAFWASRRAEYALVARSLKPVARPLLVMACGLVVYLLAVWFA